ncbi:MAG: hypothetical protein ACRD4R_12210 [Candidatus Acidiferrales bacterium]
MRFHKIAGSILITFGLAAVLSLACPKLALAGGAADAAAAAEPAALPAAPLPEAQESQSLSTLRLDQPQLAKAEKIKLVDETPSRRKWIALSAAVHGAAAFDAFTTRQAIGRGAVEADPMMKPFASSPSIYAAIQVAPLVLDYAARHMQRSQNPIIRRMWWLPQSGGAAMYLFSGAHNLGVGGRP